MKIITNNQKRPLLYWSDLSSKEQKDLDWAEPNQENWGMDFFRYRGNVYALEEFLRIEKTNPNDEWKNWDGYSTDTFFSAVLVKFPVEDWGEIDTENIIVGLALC